MLIFIILVKKLELNKLGEMDMKINIIWCGDFNAHHLLWGSEKTDYNGEVLEEFLDNENLVCLNTGKTTRFDISSGKSFGSDHYLVVSEIMVGQIQVPETLGGKWVFGKAEWGKLSRVCEGKFLQVQDNVSVESMTQEISQSILSSADEAIPKTTGKGMRRAVPWWNDECQLVVREKN